MRLTRWIDGYLCMDSPNQDNIIKKLAAYEDTGLTPEEFKESVDFVLELNKKLKPYIDAEEQGRLIILPKTLYEADNTPLIMGVTEYEVD